MTLEPKGKVIQGTVSKGARACTCVCVGNRCELIGGSVVLIDARAHSNSFNGKCTVTLSFSHEHIKHIQSISTSQCDSYSMTSTEQTHTVSSANHPQSLCPHRNNNAWNIDVLTVICKEGLPDLS